jgi:GNAT superfamily N-acetyltransferase
MESRTLAAGIIRKAGPGDAAALSDLSRRTFTQAFGHVYDPPDLATFLDAAYSHEASEDSLADPAVGVWFMEVGGAPVGYVLAGPCSLEDPDVTAACGEIKRLYLLEDWRGGGNGSRLLETALAWLERDAPRRVWLGVYSDNVGAQRLYERHGFEKVGEHVFMVGETADREFTLRRG